MSLISLLLLALGATFVLSNPLPTPPPIDEDGNPWPQCITPASYDAGSDSSVTITAYSLTTTTTITFPNCRRCPEPEPEQSQSITEGEELVPETVTIEGTGIATATQTVCRPGLPIPGVPPPKRQEGKRRQRGAGAQESVPTLNPVPSLEAPPTLSPPPVLSHPPVLPPPPNAPVPPVLARAALSEESDDCPTPIIVAPSLTAGPVRTIWTSTVTETSLVDCGGCSSLSTSTLFLGPGPAVVFEETVTADYPFTTLEFACEESGV